MGPGRHPGHTLRPSLVFATLLPETFLSFDIVGVFSKFDDDLPLHSQLFKAVYSKRGSR